jgi:DNA-binding transcriptional ArsR family regulator
LSLDRVLVALADPTRRAILGRLSHGPMRVTRIAQPFGISLNSISKHIRVLERAGLVQRRREGREHLLSLNLGPLDDAIIWMKEHHVLWTSRLDAVEASDDAVIHRRSHE